MAETVRRRIPITGRQRAVISGDQLSVISGQWPVASGQRSAVSDRSQGRLDLKLQRKSTFPT